MRWRWSIFLKSTVGTSKEFPAWSLIKSCNLHLVSRGGLRDEVCTRWSRVQYCALWPGALEGSCRLQLGNLPQYRSATDNKLMEEQNCCSQGGRGETRPALTQFPARDGATGDDIRALQYLHWYKLWWISTRNTLSIYLRHYHKQAVSVATLSFEACLQRS